LRKSLDEGGREREDKREEREGNMRDEPGREI